MSGRAAVFGFGGKQARVGEDELGEGAGDAGYSADHAVDFVAGTEGGDAGSGFFDDAGHVEAEDGGQGLARVVGFAGADLGVERVDAARVDADQHLACGGDGAGQFDGGEWASGIVDAIGEHGMLLCRAS
jgi:hypothetical protein